MRWPMSCGATRRPRSRSAAMSRRTWPSPLLPICWRSPARRWPTSRGTPRLDTPPWGYPAREGALRLEIADDGRGLDAGCRRLSAAITAWPTCARAQPAWAEPWISRAQPAKGPVSSWSFPGREPARRNPLTSDASQRPLRLLVVDDHEVVRQGLVALLDRRERVRGRRAGRDPWPNPSTRRRATSPTW